MNEYGDRGIVVTDDDPPEKDEGVFVGGVHLHDRHAKAIMRWMPPTERFQNELEVAGYWRNVLRHVTRDGIRLLAYLADNGYLSNRGEDPVEVLRALIERDLDI